MARIILILDDTDSKPTLTVQYEHVGTTPALVAAAIAVDAILHLIQRKETSEEGRDAVLGEG